MGFFFFGVADRHIGSQDELCSTWMLIYVVEIKTRYSNGGTAVDVSQERRVIGRRLVLVSRGVVPSDLHTLAIVHRRKPLSRVDRWAKSISSGEAAG